MKKNMIVAAFLLALTTQTTNAQNEQVYNNYYNALNPESTMPVVVLNEDFHAEKPGRFDRWCLEGFVGNSTRPTVFREMQVQGWSIEASALVNHFNGFTGVGPSVGLFYKTRKIRVGAEYAFIVNRYNSSAATPNKKFQSHKVSGVFGIPLLKSKDATRELELIARVSFLMDGDDIAQQAAAEKASISLDAYEHTYAIGGDGGFRYTQRFKGSPFYIFGQATVGGQGNLKYTSNTIQFIGEGKIGFGVNLEGKKKYNQPALSMVELTPDQMERIAKEDKDRSERRIYEVTR